MKALRAAGDCCRGMGAAIRRRPFPFLAAALATLALSVALPPIVLSVARKPVDFFTINPWLRRLPEYLASDAPLADKAGKLWRLALFWFSADSPYGGTEWGFAVDVADLARIVVTSLLVGAWFALWLHVRAEARVRGWTARAAGRGGALGALVSVTGLSTGPCSVMGCGAPVLPVVGLAFVGLSSTTLSALARLSTLATAATLTALVAGVACLGWLAGRRMPRAPAEGRPAGPLAGG